MSKRVNQYERLSKEILGEIIETFHLSIDEYNKRRLLNYLMNKLCSIRSDGVADGLRENRLIEKEVTKQ